MIIINEGLISERRLGIFSFSRQPGDSCSRGHVSRASPACDTECLVLVSLLKFPLSRHCRLFAFPPQLLTQSLFPIKQSQLTSQS